MVMAEINDGGPAFPTKRAALDPRASGFFTEDGMTLRDYLAARAMSALLVRVDVVAGDYVTNATPDDVATESYQYADAMLRARSAP